MAAAAPAGGAPRAFRRRALLAATVAVAAAAPALTAPTASASSIARVCAERAIVREKPGGLVVGVLEEGEAVRVLRRSKDRLWVRISVDLPAVGWIKRGALCGR